MRTKQWTVSKVYQPAAVGSGETAALLNVKKGWRVLSAVAYPLIPAAAATTSTISLGDGTSVQGLIANIDTETMVAGTPIDGAGAALLTNAGGRFYDVDDTIDAVYTTGATPGATNPKIRFIVTIRDERY